LSAASEGVGSPPVDEDPRALLPDPLNALLHEFQCSLGVVDVSGAVQDVEDLASLRDRTVERIVASVPFALLVETYGRPLCEASGRLYGSVEVKRHTCQGLSTNRVQDEVAILFAQPLDGALVHRLESSGDRGSRWQSGSSL